MRARSLIAAMTAALGCAACGFKGPLYLPQQNAAVITHPAAGSQAAPSAAPGAAPGTPHPASSTQDKQQKNPATPPPGS